MQIMLTLWVVIQRVKTTILTSASDPGDPRREYKKNSFI